MKEIEKLTAWGVIEILSKSYKTTNKSFNVIKSLITQTFLNYSINRADQEPMLQLNLIASNNWTLQQPTRTPTRPTDTTKSEIVNKVSHVWLQPDRTSFDSDPGRTRRRKRFRRIRRATCAGSHSVEHWSFRSAARHGSTPHASTQISVGNGRATFRRTQPKTSPWRHLRPMFSRVSTK